MLDPGLKPGLFMFNTFMEGYARIGDIESRNITGVVYKYSASNALI